MAVVYAVLLLIKVVTLGTFGRQFADTTRFWRDHVASSVNAVCVLYGSDSIDSFNPSLGNNASCGFVFWGVVTMILVMVVWMVVYVMMAILGRPRV